MIATHPSDRFQARCRAAQGFGFLAWAAALLLVFWERWPGPALHLGPSDLMVRCLGAGGLWLLSLGAASSLWTRHRVGLWWAWLSILPLLWPLATYLRWSLSASAGLGL